MNKTEWFPFTSICIGPSQKYVLDTTLLKLHYNESVKNDIYNPWTVMPESIIESAYYNNRKQFLEDLQNVPMTLIEKKQLFLSSYAAVRAANIVKVVPKDLLTRDLATIAQRRRMLIEQQQQNEKQDNYLNDLKFEAFWKTNETCCEYQPFCVCKVCIDPLKNFSSM